MPWAALAAIGSLAAAGAGIGQTIYSDLNKPEAPAAPSPADITKNAIAAEQSNRDAQAKSAAQLLPGLQANTNGGLSPDAYQQLSAQFSGNAGAANSPQLAELVNKFLGQDQSSTFGGSTNFGSSNPTSPGLVPDFSGSQGFSAAA